MPRAAAGCAARNLFGNGEEAPGTPGQAHADAQPGEPPPERRTVCRTVAEPPGAPMLQPPRASGTLAVGLAAAGASGARAKLGFSPSDGVPDVRSRQSLLSLLVVHVGTSVCSGALRIR